MRGALLQASTLREPFTPIPSPPGPDGRFFTALSRMIVISKRPIRGGSN
jgi:hypothetical protein